MSTATTTENSSKDVSELAQRLAGKYLTFKLANEDYGLEILKVQEIIQMQTVTHVPKTPEYIRGVINLRGKVIPVIELRKKFSMNVAEDTEKTCIIVVQVGSSNAPLIIGIIIDEVSEVLDINAKDIQDAPSFGSQVNTDYIMGVGKINNKVKMLLDIDKVLTVADTNLINEIS